jgi:hypothetical protein
MLKFLALIPVILWGCASQPLETRYAGPKNDASIAIAMQPGERNQRTQLYYSYRGVWFPEGEIVHAAALDEFGKRFSSVRSRETITDFEALVEVEGDSILNPQLSTYYATATARAYSPAGKHLGTYRATADAYVNMGNLEYDDVYGRTYRRAFAEVARQFAASDAAKTIRKEPR